MRFLLAFGGRNGVDMVGMIVAAVVGGLLAVGAAFGLVSSQSSAPTAVTSPYVVYGES